jgi:hypothetical protein
VSAPLPPRRSMPGAARDASPPSAPPDGLGYDGARYSATRLFESRRAL